MRGSETLTRAAVAAVAIPIVIAAVHLGGRHRDDKDRKDLATQMRKKEREGHQVDIDGAEHQLQAHQDDQDIASAQHAVEADDK